MSLITECPGKKCPVNSKAQWKCVECDRPMCRACLRSHKIPLANQGHTIEELSLTRPEASTRCQSCGTRFGQWECSTCPESLKLFCKTCQDDYHSTLPGDHNVSWKFNTPKPKGKTSIRSARNLKDKSGAKSKRRRTALKKDREMHQLGVKVLRIAVHPRRKINDIEVTGSRCIVNVFTSQGLRYGRGLKLDRLKEFRWSLGEVFSDEEDNGSDYVPEGLQDHDMASSQDQQPEGHHVSPAKTNAFATPYKSPIRKNVRPPNPAVAQPADYSKKSPIKKVRKNIFKKVPPVKKKASKQVDSTSDEESEASFDSDDSDRESVGSETVEREFEPVLLIPPIVPYDTMPKEALITKIYEYYPNFENTREGEKEIRKLRKEFDQKKDTCGICGQRPGYQLQCIGVMPGNYRCVRRAHPKCTTDGLALYVCEGEGCWSSQPEHAADMSHLVALWFYHITASCLSTPDQDKQYRAWQAAVSLFDKFPLPAQDIPNDEPRHNKASNKGDTPEIEQEFN